MGRVEEAINVVHLLADQAAQNSDRRRVFPIVVCTRARRRCSIVGTILDATHPNGRGENKRSSFDHALRRAVKIGSEQQSPVDRRSR